MKCPSCSASPLQPLNLESELKASGCVSCEGRWITAKNYWDWLDRHGDRLPEKEPDGVPIQPSDSQHAKLCPHCRRIMLRYKVGHGLSFTVDQCGSCNGVWLDADEWEALKQRNLHDEIHLIFSAAWQSQIRKDRGRKMLCDIYTERFGIDYEKVKQIKVWLNNHPEKVHILNYLSNSDPYAVTY